MGEEVAAESTPRKPPHSKRKRATPLACNMKPRRENCARLGREADKAMELAATEGLTLIRSAASNSG